MERIFRRQINRIKAGLIITPIVLILMSVGKWRGKLAEWRAPKLTSSVLKQSTLPFEEQKKLYLEFEIRICRAITPCLESTHTSDSTLIKSKCEEGLSQLNSIYISRELPSAVRENMKIYLSSSKNTANLLMDAWKTKAGRVKGASLFSTMTNWEIDTCSSKSIPQKMRRLFDLHPTDSKTIMNCKDIEQIYQTSIQ